MLASLASARGYQHHFAHVPGQAFSRAVQRNLAAQLITAWGLSELAPGGVLPMAANEPGWLLVADPECQEVTRLRTEALTEAVLQATVPWNRTSSVR